MRQPVKSPGRGRPAKPEQRVEEKAAARARILAAARRLIVARGFRSLSIRALAAQVRYAPGTIYLYSPSREAIARELCLAGYRELLAQLQAAVRVKASPEVNFRALFTAYVDFGLHQPDTYRLIFMEEPEYLAAVFAERPPDDPATQSYQLLVEAAHALPVAGKARSQASAVKLAEAGWAAVHGIVSLKLSCPGFPRSSPETLCRRLLDGLMKG